MEFLRFAGFGCETETLTALPSSMWSKEDGGGAGDEGECGERSGEWGGWLVRRSLNAVSVYGLAIKFPVQ